MNAVAVRAFAPGDVVVRTLPIRWRLPELKYLVLIFLLLISAFGMLYVKDLNRRLFITSHKLQVQSEQLQADSNKLLLEQSAWSAQARVQQVAEQQLHMQLPSAGDVVMIKI